MCRKKQQKPGQEFINMLDEAQKTASEIKLHEKPQNH